MESDHPFYGLEKAGLEADLEPIAPFAEPNFEGVRFAVRYHDDATTFALEPNRQRKFQRGAGSRIARPNYMRRDSTVPIECDPDRLLALTRMDVIGRRVEGRCTQTAAQVRHSHAG